MSIKRKITDLAVNGDLFKVLMDADEEGSVGALKVYLENLPVVDRAVTYTRGGYDLALKLSEELDKEEAIRIVELLKGVDDVLYESTKSFLDIHLKCGDLLKSVGKIDIGLDDLSK